MKNNFKKLILAIVTIVYFGVSSSTITAMEVTMTKPKAKAKKRKRPGPGLSTTPAPRDKQPRLAGDKTVSSAPRTHERPSTLSTEPVVEQLDEQPPFVLQPTPSAPPMTLEQSSSSSSSSSSTSSLSTPQYAPPSVYPSLTPSPLSDRSTHSLSSSSTVRSTSTSAHSSSVCPGMVSPTLAPPPSYTAVGLDSMPQPIQSSLLALPMYTHALDPLSPSAQTLLPPGIDLSPKTKLVAPELFERHHTSLIKLFNRKDPSNTLIIVKACCGLQNGHNGLTILHILAMNPNHTYLQKYLAIAHKAFPGKTTIDPLDASNYTPLAYAVIHAHPQNVMILLKAGASPTFTFGSKRQTLLHFSAAIKNDSDALAISKFLMGCPSTKLTKKDSDGNNTLHIAVTQKYKVLVEALLYQCYKQFGKTATKAFVNDQNIAGETALHTATRNVDIPTITLLLGYYADPSIVNAHGQTIIHIAAGMIYTPHVGQMIGLLLSKFPVQKISALKTPDIDRAIPIKCSEQVAKFVADAERPGLLSRVCFWRSSAPSPSSSSLSSSTLQTTPSPEPSAPPAPEETL